ncbi:hypothetical protein BJ165DRAFT_1521825 [Panaeolus papilionaceus]|nr:hypothetical protein BJ165DRAFT_1521825 [Panaeolus papilionaceus]
MATTKGLGQKPFVPPPPHNRTLGQSWLALPARTRLYVSLAFCAVGATGIVVSNYLEGSPKESQSNPTS